MNDNKLKQDPNQIRDFYEFLDHDDFTVFQGFLTDHPKSNTIHKDTDNRYSYPTKSEFITSADDLIDLCKRYKNRGVLCAGINERHEGVNKLEDGFHTINLIVFDIDVKDTKRNNGIAAKTFIWDGCKEVMDNIIQELHELGYTVDYKAFSGNGFHIGVKLDIEIPEYESKKEWKESDMHKRLVYLEDRMKKYDTEHVKIDTITKDIVRRLKIPGTYNIKRYKTDNGKYRMVPEYRLCKILEMDKNPDTESNNNTFFNMEISDITDHIPESKKSKNKDLSHTKKQKNQFDISEFNKLLESDKKLRKFYNGDLLSEYDNDRSRCEEAFIIRLLEYDFDKNETYQILSHSNIGKFTERINEGTEDSYFENSYNNAVDWYNENHKDRLQDLSKIELIPYYKKKFHKEATYPLKAYPDGDWFYTTAFDEWYDDLKSDTESDKKSKEEIEYGEKIDSLISDHKEEAIKFLQDPNKFDTVRDLLSKDGLFGDDDLKVTFYILSAGAGFGIYAGALFLGGPGCGKSFMIKKVLGLDEHTGLLPEWETVFASGASPKAIHHLDFGARNKLFIDEIQNSPETVQAIKSFDNGVLRYLTNVKNPKTGEWEPKLLVKRHVSPVGTTTKTDLDREFFNRVWILTPKSTADHREYIADQKIKRMMYKDKYQQTRENELIPKMNTVKAALKIAESDAKDTEIQIIYAMNLKPMLNFEFERANRDFEKMKDVLEIITSLNYRNRIIYAGIYKNIIVSHPDDLRVFMKYVFDIYSNLAKNLSDTKMRILQILSDLGWYAKDDVQERLKSKTGTTIEQDTVQKYLKDLENNGYLESQRDEDDHRVKIYKRKSNESFKFLTTDDKKEIIENSNAEYKKYITELIKRKKDDLIQCPKKALEIDKKKKPRAPEKKKRTILRTIKNGEPELKMPEDRSNDISDTDRDVGKSINRFMDKD